MKHKRLMILFILLASMVGIAIYGAYNYYAPPQLREPYQLSAQKDDTIRIAYIGDSWAFMHKDHKCLIPRLLSELLNNPIKVNSYGICGLSSKEIYENFFENTNFRNYLQKSHYQYCFISAGINDTYKKMSTTYYKKSMDGIIKFLLANNIRPIILEIPDYDIHKAYRKQKTEKKLLRRMSMLINGTPIDCKQDFRDALGELIREKGYQDKVSVIRYKSWNSNYKNDLKQLYRTDGMHLNEYGYEVLDSVIAKEVIHYL